MNLIEQLIAAATGDDAGTALQALIDADRITAKSGLVSKEQELLGKLANLKQWKQFQADDISADDVLGWRASAEAAEAARLKAEGKGDGDDEIIEAKAEAKAEKRISLKLKEFEAIEKRLQATIDAQAISGKALEAAHLAACKEFELYRVAGSQVDPLMWAFFKDLGSKVMHEQPVLTEDGEQPWWTADRPTFALLEAGSPIQGEKGNMKLPEWMTVKGADADFSARFLKQNGSGGGGHRTSTTPASTYDPKAPAREDLEVAYDT